MKVIKYQFLSDMVNDEPYLIGKTIPYSAENEEIVKTEAYNGEYTIEDNGVPEPTPSDSDSAVWDELDAAYQEGVDSV